MKKNRPTISRLLAISIVFLTGFAVYSQPLKIDVTHYRFELELTDTSDIIKGKATIFFKPLATGKTVTLDFADYAAGKGMNVLGIYKGLRDDNRLTFKREDEKLTVNFIDPLAANTEQQITILYWGVPKDGLIISKNKYGHRTFFGDNWPNRGHNWIPCIDDPGDKASVEFIVTAPQHYQVVGNGVLAEETNIDNARKLTHWKEDIPIATKVMVIGAAEFAVGLAGIVNDCIPVYSWVYPEDRAKGFYDYEQATGILSYYIKTFGPYGFKKLANVQSKTTFGGLENANTIFYHENSVTGDRSSESLMAHEIAHQWFGNMVTEKSFAHLWLSEGFSTYLAILYMENKHGIDTARYMLAEDRAEVIDFVKKNQQAVIDSSSDYMELLNPNNYQKGGWILHMLRKQLGDSVFFTAIKAFYAGYAGKNAETSDFQKIVERVSGKNLSVFFNQWLYTPGIPKLDIGWKYVGAEKKILLTVKQTQKIPFTFPLTIQLNMAGSSSQTKILDISKKEQVFSFAVRGKPQDITADPGMNLLFEGSVHSN